VFVFWGGGSPNECGRVYMYTHNMIHTQIGGQEKNGRIKPVQRVRGGCTYDNDTVFDFPSTPRGSIHVHGGVV